MRAWDWVLIVLLVGSVGVMFWYEAATDASTRQALVYLDFALVAFFVIEWFYRVAKAAAPGRYALRHSWELFGMVPLAPPVPGFLRFLRLFRLVRILRVFGRLGEALGTWERIAKESNLGPIALASGSITLAGAALVWLMERNAPDAHITDFRIAIWWAIVTVTPVGYGDVLPSNTAGRLVATALMLTGLGLIPLITSVVVSILVSQRNREAREEELQHLERIYERLDTLERRLGARDR